MQEATIAWQDTHDYISRTLKEHAGHMTVTVLTSGDTKWHLHLGPYRAARDLGMLEVVISAPSPHVVDVLVAMGGMFARKAWFILVSINHISHAPTA